MIKILITGTKKIFITIIFFSLIHLSASDIISGEAVVGDNYIQWNNVLIGTTRPYNISFKYKLTSLDLVPLAVYIDDVKFQNLDFERTNIIKWSMNVTKMLSEGEHTIKIETIGYGNLPLIKSLRISDAPPVQLIIDTDMLTDCDDAAALGVAHALEDNGEAKILGVMLSAHDVPYKSDGITIDWNNPKGFNSNTVEAINYYYNGNNDIPVGALYNIQGHNAISNTLHKNFRFDKDKYHKRIKNQAMGRGKDNTNRGPSSYRRYLEILQDAEDNSIIITVLGTNYNIIDFLEKNTDGKNAEWHQNLFNTKVKEIVFADANWRNPNMCGRGKSEDGLSEGTNRMFTILRTLKRVKITYLSNITHEIYTGEIYKREHTTSPMAIAYKYASNNQYETEGNIITDNGSWDQIMVLLAVRGINYLNESYYYTVDDDGGYYTTNFDKGKGNATWHTDSYQNQRKLKEDNTTQNNTKVTNTLTELMGQTIKNTYHFPSTNIQKYVVTITPSSDIIDFVTRLYINALNRNPDQGGLIYWSNELANHMQTGVNIGYNFIFSQEFINRNLNNSEYIEVLYNTFLNRESDESGFNYWMNQLNGDFSRADVLSSFSHSQEFVNLCDSYRIQAF